MSSSPDQWRHVPTAVNPADYLTRGVEVEELVNLKIWWEGPEYLKQGESTWPRNVTDKELSDALKEVKKDTCQDQIWITLVQCCLDAKE